MAKVVVTFYLKMRNEFRPFPTKGQASDWMNLQVKQLEAWLSGGKLLEFISLSQIKHEYILFFSKYIALAQIICSSRCTVEFLLDV